MVALQRRIEDIAIDEKDKQSAPLGTVLWLIIVIGTILSSLIQKYLKRHHLLTDELALTFVGSLIGFGFMSLVRFWLRKSAWFQRVEGNKRIQKALNLAFFGLVNVYIAYMVVMVCWRLWTDLKR